MNRSSFEKIKDAEKRILERLTEWGVLEHLTYLPYPDEWNGIDTEESLTIYQRGFCQRLASKEKLCYLSISSMTGREVDGAPPNGIVLSLRVICGKSRLIYLSPRKLGGVRIYGIYINNDELEVVGQKPNKFEKNTPSIMLLSEYLEFLYLHHQIIPAESIEAIVGSNIYNAYLAGAEEVDVD